MLELLRRLERVTRPVDPQVRAVLARRWAELPEVARTPAQVLGRHAVGCEGTHGVFPRCNLACTPCYHSRDANRVRIDGAHTLAEVERQMAFLRHHRGPRAHAQLIGGEVSLLDPDDHAAALQIMRRHGREPMSMTHGDFDYQYLERLAIGPDGRRRLDRLSFAGHFDSLMHGRRGLPRPAGERDLNPYRQRFCELFRRLRHQHGVRFFLAHNMTVTPRNLGEVAQVVRDCRQMGFGMLSFQPAAFVGDQRRWADDYQSLDAEGVWAEIERGAGTRLPWRAIQFGDERCNRTAFGFQVGARWVVLLDDRDPADLRVRDLFYRHLGGVNFSGAPLRLLLPRLARVALAHPGDVRLALGWAARVVRRAGGPWKLVRQAARRRVRPMSFVMHRFMHAADVAPAWELERQGRTSHDPRIRATQERLRACAYAMAHPETGQLVPACVQHSVLDPAENLALRRRLPLVERP
jgi:hypothetical protein